MFSLFAFSGNLNAQTYTITGNVNSSTLNCASFTGKKIISIGDGVNFASLRMDSNLDLTSPNTCVLGPVEIIINNNANIDFSVNNSDLRLPAGSSITFNGSGTLYSGAVSQCSASDRIYIGGVLLATCEGKAGAISFTDLVNQGGYNIVKASILPKAVCGSGSFSIVATAIPSAGATINWYDVAIGGSLIFTGATYTTSIISSSTIFYVEASYGSGSSAYKSSRTAVVAPVNPLPTITGILSICIGANASLTGSDTANATTPWVSGTSGVATVNSLGIVTGVSAGTSVITYTNSNGCANTVTLTVNPNSPASVAIAASPSGAICLGTSVVFTATPTNGGAAPAYQWKLNGTNVGTNSTTYTNSTMVNGDVVSCVMTSNAICVTGSPATSNAVKITVNTIPDNTATGFSSSSFCIGNQATITFNANNGSGKLPYKLLYKNETTSTTATADISTNNPTSIILSPNPTVTTNYTLLSITDANGCVNYFAKDVKAEVTIVPLPSEPTIGTIIHPTCSVPLGSFTITNYNASYIYTVTPNTSVSQSGSTITAPAGNYTITASLGACTSLPLKDVLINVLVTNKWDGLAWSISPKPNSNQSIEFNGDYKENVDVEGCSCNVKLGKVTIATGKTMTITNGVTISGGQLIFENNASLVQTNDTAINSGNITYKRYTTKVKRYDFTYWSSPVAAQKLFDLSPNTLYDKYYGYSPATGWLLYYNGNATMEVGKGYIVRAPQNFSITNAVIDTAPQFIGVPNNGVKQITIGPASDYLLGNPYPSAIDAEKFLRDNTGTSGALEGTLYFWTHNSPPSDAVAGSATYNYTNNDYASYNLTGGVKTSAAKMDADLNDPNDNNNINQPLGKIAAGQGFFARSSTTGGTVTFDNSMRQIEGASIDNSQFFKMKNSKGESANAIEKHRIWLNLTNNQGAFKQLLVGYISGATNGYEGVFDGESYNGNGFVDLYTIIGDKNLTIQGRTLPFNENDVVPIGFRSTIEGLFTINIDEVDGLFTSQGVFLEDKNTNSIKNLKEGGYTFTTISGTFNDRFVLRFINANKTLGTGTFELNDNAVVIAKDKNELKIKSQQENIKRITVFDLLGRKVFDKDSINSNEFRTSNIVLTNQMVLVKVTLTDGKVISKKVIY